MPAPFPPVTYHGLTYTMNHLQDRSIPIQTNAGIVTCTVKFSFHCFTDHQGEHLRPEMQDDRPKYCDGDSNEQDRVFCPRRWSWSHWLPGIFNRLSHLKIVCYHDNNCTLVTTQNVGPAFQAPYAIYFDVGMVRSPKNETILHVNSAYINDKNPPNMTNAQRFAFLLQEAMTRGKRLGAK